MNVEILKQIKDLINQLTEVGELYVIRDLAYNKRMELEKRNEEFLKNL